MLRIVLVVIFLISCVASGLWAQVLPMQCADKHTTVGIDPPLALDTRSDSVDILSTALTLDLTEPPSLRGVADLLLAARLSGISEVSFDLAPVLEVDSLWVNGLGALFSRSGIRLRVIFPEVLDAGEEVEIKLLYHGIPPTDASGWGGVYYQGGIFYNLGVGFDADPHSFGRAWFPCFDNFVERCPFLFEVHTPVQSPAFCNGILVSDKTEFNNRRIRTWVMEDPIPAYLACFSSGNFTTFERQVPGVGGPIPLQIAALAADTNKVRATFEHLPEAVAAYEHWYGPYVWDKIGYTLVPFNSGAMEHATNVAIMRLAIDGTKAYETLWAHELSHHWWGNLATCSTAEDMWLNEGWAVYSEHLFTEWVYGRAAYLAAVEDNFLDVLQTAHVLEGGYRAVSGLPHGLTYGKHVYNKGAVIGHQLRTYLGDSLFRLGIRSVLAAVAFDDWSSADLRDRLEEATGVDLHPFFEQQVFAPGFCHFDVDSFRLLPTVPPGKATYRVYVRQKLRGAPALYDSVPLRVALRMPGGQLVYGEGVVSGATGSLLVEVAGGVPVYAWTNPDLGLLMARSAQERQVTGTGNVSLSRARMSLAVQQCPDTAWIRVEHHFVEPDNGSVSNPEGFALSTRYWTVYTDFPVGFQAAGTVFYDGRGGFDLLDTPLFDATGALEDSVVLLYRPGAGHPWRPMTGVVRNPLGSVNDRYGFLRMNTILAGEYTIGKGAVATSVGEIGGEAEVAVMPNPARGSIRVEADFTVEAYQLVDGGGQVCRSGMVGGNLLSIDSAGLAAGTYWLVLSGQATLVTREVVLQ